MTATPAAGGIDDGDDEQTICRQAGGAFMMFKTMKATKAPLAAGEVDELMTPTPWNE